MYKSCTPQICRKACCTTMTSVNGANARTNATIQTSRPVPSPVFGEMNAPYDCESSRPGVVLSERYFQQMLTAAGVALKPELFCVQMRHLAHPQTCTKTETVKVGHFADTVKTCHTSSWQRQRHVTKKQNTTISTYSLFPTDFFTWDFVLAIDVSILTRKSLMLLSSPSLLLTLLGECMSSTLSTTRSSDGDTPVSSVDTGISRLSRRNRLSDAQSWFTRRISSICNIN